MKKMLPVILLIPFLSSCFSYKIANRDYRNFNYPLEKRKAYVVNKELKKEYRILQQSGLFELVDDSTNQLKIQLYAMQKNFMCGTGLMAWALLGGQVPASFPDTYHYRFDEMMPNDTTSNYFELHINKRYWFWDLFAVRRKEFYPKAGKVLAAAYYYNTGITD